MTPLGKATHPAHRYEKPGAGAGGTLSALIFLFAAAAGARTASAQETDARWLAWMGCWQPVGETAGETAPDALLCFQPLADDVGVEMVSVEGGEIVARETVRADGRRHDSELEGCTGWERGDFSARPGRVYLSSEHLCDGGVTREQTGLLATVSTEEWVDVSVVAAEDERTTWVMRYRLADESRTDAAGFAEVAAGRETAVRSARVAASARPSVDDVIEANEYVDADGVGAWIAERGTPLDVNADKLVRMADAGVPEEVIDMVIAVSYPSRFAIDRDREAERYGPDGSERYGTRGGWGYYDPFYGWPFYSPFGVYSPFWYGYGYGYGYVYRGYYGPIIVKIDRADSRDPGGRVINGMGYRRGSRTSGSGAARSPSIKGSSGSVSRGSSGRKATGRTAKRRKGGGSGGGDS